jgi:hypothetical protein
VLARLGLSLSAASLLLFYVARFAFALSWLAAGRAYGIPFGLLVFSVAFSLLITYPSTTTEIFESISVALLFLALSRWLSPKGGGYLGSAAIAGGTFFRFAAVKLLVFYGLVEWIRRPRPGTLIRVVLVGVPPLALYLFCTRFIGGEATPYHGVGPGHGTRWALLLKGIYYAATGGWSPSSLVLRALFAGLIALAAAGFVRMLKSGPPPEWIVLLIAFEAYSLFFLIVTQVLYGSMYADIQPAFATPRFFTLTMPLNIAALLFLSPLLLSPRIRPALTRLIQAAAGVILLLCLAGWVVQNHRIMAGMSTGPDGYLRFADVAAIYRVLQSEQFDGVFDGTGVLMYTAVDARLIYPDNVREIRAERGARIAVVRYAAEPNKLLSGLEKQIGPEAVQRSGRYEVDLFTLPARFDLKLEPRPGFVPHIQ